MAANGAPTSYTPSHVLQAVVAMRGADREAKKQAHEYLERFQKSKDAWTLVIGILQSEADAEAKLFAATTLRGKLTYDLSTDIPDSELLALRDQLLLLLKHYAAGMRPIRVQLCVCLAVLAIHMKEWKDVLPVVVSALQGPESHAAVLDFLRVLPEEVTEGRKITLSEEELSQRTKELLSDNADQVVQLLVNYAQASAKPADDPLLMECITSWLREVPVSTIVGSPLCDVVFAGVIGDSAFREAAETVCTILKETREVDDNQDIIQVLLPRILRLRSGLDKVIAEEDTEAYQALTKVFASAAEAWVVAVVREPGHFGPLVDVVLECAMRDENRDVIEHTFDFWYELKQYLVIERYMEARVQFVDVYSRLVNALFKHLQYPKSSSGDENDLFEGDREAEERFREFRHRMGDTLKDACAVMGVTDCLSKVLATINKWSAERSTATSHPGVVPHWQELEAPLFAMRAMGQMVPPDESIVLPQLMPLLVAIPNHEKLRFATIMVLGRYTEWTAAHREYLEPQFNYIVSAFQTDSKEVIRAAAMAIKYFCTDCKELLSGQVLQLQTFYDQILDKLPDLSQEEITEGVASVVAAQPPTELYKLLKLYCDPLVQRLMNKANNASDDDGKVAVADHVQLITIFVQTVKPYSAPGTENPAVKYWQEVFPVLATIVENFLDFVPICERICRCWRYMIISNRTAMTPLLPELANKLASGFAASRQGAFLWVTAAILREFSEDREHVDQSITQSIYAFFEAQATTFLRVLNEIQPSELPDVIEDFFRLLIDALLYYPHRLVPSELLGPIFEASIYALTLEQRDPLSATLHFLRDLLTYGGDNPATSDALPADVAAQIRTIIRALLASHGEKLVKQVMAGMMITFPRDCFADGSGVLLAMFELLPTETTAWVERTLQLLPQGTVSPAEANRLMTKIKERIGADPGSMRQVRALLQDFTNTYRRRYVAPRDGLGQLEADRFRFNR
ncbi:karyopherin [Sodiomyces alkalinus F11]|uniref:Karyopherin n=1 Tax=Sodiomyces alkalinus (strain CBS 110278 / VKM F-3762 / F11) TaxID=1314773 RepID=A0A3N2PWL1_SODAK|nr:karyopherin [Sodiomyces alkalinus F11]ROT38725.1 karyopherin [Sodiomyces alkalinus F11]